MFASFVRPSAPALFLLLAGCVAEKKAEPIAGNVLVGAKAEPNGVPHVDRLVDGQGTQEGEFWDTPASARFERPDGHVVWDLGQARALRCALVQGDNNDTYHLAGSPDGKAWAPLWDAGPANGAGMRVRFGKFEGNARFVRLSGSGGDNLYSAAEVAVFTDCPAGWPAFDLPRVEAVAPDSAAGGGGVWTVSLGLFAIALIAFVILTRRRGEPPGPPSSTP